MVTSGSLPRRVTVILDREFGERLRLSGSPIWIELSPTNEPIVRELWKEQPEPNHLLGVTGLPFQPEVCAEDRLLSELDTIDLHHGPYSTPEPYTELVVIGCTMRPDIRAALANVGFDCFEEDQHGFRARRTPEQAAIMR
jgi:hypothetical protein